MGMVYQHTYIHTYTHTHTHIYIYIITVIFKILLLGIAYKLFLQIKMKYFNNIYKDKTQKCIAIFYSHTHTQTHVSFNISTK